LKLALIDKRSHPISRKNPKTLSGIETQQQIMLSLKPKSRKNPKTLSGIETQGIGSQIGSILSAGKTLKPYQGLKHFCSR